MNDYFGPMWEGSAPDPNFRLERLGTGKGIELSPGEVAKLKVALDFICESGVHPTIKHEYRELLEKLRGI